MLPLETKQSNLLTVRITATNTLPSVAATNKIECVISAGEKNPYRQRYKSDMSFRHICGHNPNDCPAKQLISNNKGIFCSKLCSAKCAVLKRMAVTFLLSFSRPTLDA